MIEHKQPGEKPSVRWNAIRVERGGGLARWEATPIAERRVWFTVEVKEALEAGKFDVPALEWLVSQIEMPHVPGDWAQAFCGGFELRIELMVSGRWLVSFAKDAPALGAVGRRERQP